MPPVCSVSCHLLHLFSQPILAATLGNAKSRHCKQARKPTGQNHLYVPSTQHTAWPQSCCCCVLAQSCLILCDPMACSPPGSSVGGIFQARILEWIVISFSRGSFQSRDQTRVFFTGSQVLYPQAPSPSVSASKIMGEWAIVQYPQFTDVPTEAWGRQRLAQQLIVIWTINDSAKTVYAPTMPRP